MEINSSILHLGTRMRWMNGQVDALATLPPASVTGTHSTEDWLEHCPPKPGERAPPVPTGFCDKIQNT